MKSSTNLQQLAAVALPLVSALTLEVYASECGATHFFYSYTAPGEPMVCRTDTRTTKRAAYKLALETIVYNAPRYRALVSSDSSSKPACTVYELEYAGIANIALLTDIAARPGFDTKVFGLGETPQQAYQDALRAAVASGFDISGIPTIHPSLDGLPTVAEHEAHGPDEDGLCCVAYLHLKRTMVPTIILGAAVGLN